MAEPRERADIAVLAEIARIDQRVRAALERVLPDGLSASQFAVLGHLAAAGDPRSPGALATAFSVTRGAMTNTLARLEARGLATITADRMDRRRKWVVATERGLETHRACLSAAKAARDGLRGAFGAEAFEAALPFLRQVRLFLEGGG